MEAAVEDRFRGAASKTTRETRSNVDTDATEPTLNGSFDCNICLDNAVEPVVTLCGHLYCWPCIYKWLRLESSAPQRCPVCKATLSQTALVPLYGRGYDSKAVDDALDDVPRRPSIKMTASFSDSATATSRVMMAQHAAQQHQHQHQHHHHPHGGNYTMSASSTATTTTRVLHPMLGGMAVAVLPWVLGEQGMRLYYPSPYDAVVSGDSPRLRRQEMQARRSLHRISAFLFCCALLCLLLF